MILLLLELIPTIILKSIIICLLIKVVFFELFFQACFSFTKKLKMIEPAWRLKFLSWFIEFCNSLFERRNFKRVNSLSMNFSYILNLKMSLRLLGIFPFTCFHSFKKIQYLPTKINFFMKLNKNKKKCSVFVIIDTKEKQLCIWWIINICLFFILLEFYIFIISDAIHWTYWETLHLLLAVNANKKNWFISSFIQVYWLAIDAEHLFKETYSVL